MRIDVHAHYYPPAFLEVLDRAYATPTTPREIAVRRVVDGKIRPTPAMYRIEERLEVMQRVGVDRQALSVSIPQAYHADRATAVALAQSGNDGTAAVCQQYPDRFWGLASLPLPHVADALAELTRAIDQLGLHGVVLGGNVLLEGLDAPAFAPVFDALDARRLPVLIHPMIPCGVEGMADYDLAAAVGYPMDSCVAALRLVYSGTCERCPNLTPVLCHAGGYLPFQWGRLDASYHTRPEARARISQPPTAYLRRFYYDNCNFHVPALRCAIDTVGISQLVLGSDQPFGLGDLEQMVGTLDGLGLSAADRASVESGNALRLFGQSVPAA